MSGIYHENKLWANVSGPNVAGATPSENLSTLTIDGVTYDTTELVFCYDDNGSLYTDSTKATAVSGDDSKLYIATNTGKQYRYNGSAFSALGVNAINDLSDVTITSASDGQALEYDATAGKWKNVAKKAADTPTFSEASTRANLSGSGETMTTILGKIKKWFSDLKDLAFKAIDGSNSKKYLRGDGTWQSALELQGRVYESGDDEGLVIKPASNHWAGISLVNNTGRHTYFAMKDGQSDVPLWRFNDGSNAHDIIHPAKSGTVALTSDITDEKVTGQTQNPSSITAYNVPFIGTTNQKPYYNDGLKYSTKEGDASNVGVGQLWLGNGTSSGTAGNKKGSIILYGEKNGYANLKASPNSTTDRDIIFPDASGTVALTSDIPAAVAVKGDKESTYRTGNVNLTPANIGAVYYAGNLNTTLPSGTPAAETIAYWESNVPAGSVVLGYNSAGEEFTLIFSKGANNQYGSIIKYGYGSKYIRILRKQANQWKSNDWEVMDAGYADTAGSAPASDVYAWAKEANKPTYTHDEIGAGYIKVGDGTNYQLFRFDNGWRAGMYYHTNGDEAMVFGNKNTRTSWIFANTDPEARAAWTDLSPAMHIKNGKVAIGKLIANSAYLTYPLEVNGDVQATNFRGALIGNADTATQATKDGDGNVISSTYAKKASVYKSAVSDSKSSWTAGEGWFADTIGPETKGVYVFIGWAEFDGSLGGRRGIKLARHNSSSTVMASAFTSESADSGYPRTVTCVEYVTCGTDAAVSLAWRRLRLYTANNLSSGTIKGGVIMIKISDL